MLVSRVNGVCQEAHVDRYDDPMTGRRRPSQRDVAARAGVSRTTVSFVLNDVPDVAIPAATRARILAAA